MVGFRNSMWSLFEVRTLDQQYTEELTQRNRWVPPQSFFADRSNVRKPSIIAEVWKTVMTNDTINLFLCLRLHVWIHSYRQKNGLKSGRSLTMIKVMPRLVYYELN